MNPNSFRTLTYVAWLGLAGCSDELAVIGHFHAMRDAAPETRVDAGDGAMDPDAAESGMPPRPEAGTTPPPSGDALAIEPGARAQFCAGNGSALRVVSAARASSTSPICTPGIGRRLF